MVFLWVGLAGIPVGVLLDRLVTRLAVALPGAGEDGEGRGQPGNGTRGTASGGRRQLLIIVAVTAASFAGAGARFDHAGHLALATAYIAVLIVCAGTDILSFRVPNVVTYPAILLAFIAGLTMPDTSAWGVLAAGAIAGGIFLLPALLTGGIGIGVGDAKLAAFCGLALGLRGLVPALLIAALLGGAVGAVLLISGRRGRRDPIPYAPFIAAGALAALLWRGAAFAQLS